jgi:hypothetical protein
VRLRALAAVAVALSALSVTFAGPALGDGLSASSSTQGSTPAFTKTETIVRENLSGGTEQVVDQRSVSLSVSQTTNLRGRQEIAVSWSGAHPTSGIVADPNSIDAQQEEYPMVLLECRGVDSTAASPSEQLSPSTCWTQSWNERYQDTFSTRYPAYRLDQFASVADRAQVVGAPNPLPTACNFLPAPTQFWVPFTAANGATYYGGPSGCAGQPPEADNVGGSALPSNETFGVSGLDGTGQANFDVWTSAENASLGCSTTVPCSLVAVPIMGTSCDPTGSLVSSVPADVPPPSQESAAAASCEAGAHYAPGQLVIPQGNESLAVSGSLWWSASNWRNRIVVPLSFAVPASACDVVSNASALDIYGSELMIQATQQWEPFFCLNAGLTPFVHVQTGEPEARNLVADGTVSAALTSEPDPTGYGKPVANAPVAVTGFAISYLIDGANGQPYTSLRMTPLLLAKLLTESYPGDLVVKEEDPALAHNPLNITLDPEFIALNPGIKQGVAASEAASELMSISSDSDVIEALTSYINADPTARVWLNGSPDQYGMVVNPAYKGIELPVDQWPLLSTFEPKLYYASDNNDCLYHSPVPYLPLISAPVATLEDVSENMQFGIANSTTVCSQIDGTTTGEKLVTLGRQTVGYRFLIGVTPLADTQRYLLDTAALLTSDGDFVAPTDTSLETAASLLSFDASSGTWPIPYSQIATSSSAAAAYPGTMVVYAAVPTSGLSASIAAQLATWLRFAATTGQTPGLGVGNLPPGYLPINAADDLSSFVTYTEAVADDVQAQNGEIPGEPNATVPVPVPVPVPNSSTFTPETFSSPTLAATTTQVIYNSTEIPLLLSIEGRTLRIALGSTGGVIAGTILLVLLFASGAFGGIVLGRRRGIW